MERNVITQGIVLSSVRSGTVDRTLRILSEDLGVIDVRNYGARKANKAVKAEVSTEGTFYLYVNPVKHSYTLTDIAIRSMHETLRQDLSTTYTALFFSEFILKTNGGDWVATYQLLSQALGALEDPVVNKVQCVIQFIWAMIGILGLRPDLDRCPVCDSPYGQDEILGFSWQLTAPCCLKCATVKDDMLLPPGARRYLSVTAPMPFGSAVHVDLNPGTRERIKRYMLRYAVLVAGELKTLDGPVLQTMT
ncbi:MAG: DNA repair protein RecO [Sphaerochaeta sp.]|jgi:DNA repair protein RecO (recombination protein O)|nr:DNA repair protein RecO [Sphaerochaeta sp.]MCI2103800.1 DNA repair protein RecO [Sphaerochaeta sp.]